MFATSDQDTPPSLPDIVREETEDGRLVVRFLVNVMQGGLDDAKPCHRLDAARQLLALGLLEAQAFVDANTPRQNHHPVVLPAGRTQDPSPASSSLHQELAALVREETDNGRTAVRFLVDVMQGDLPGFKPRHRLSAAKELLHRGFDAPAPAGTGDRYAAAGSPGSQPEESPASIAAAAIKARLGRYAHYPAGYNRYKMEPGPFTFETYDDEDFHFDCFGAYAMEYILGGEEATEAATMAVINYRYPPDRDPDAGACPGPVPDEAPLPEDIYGFKALLRIYETEGAARVAAMGAAQYHREQAARAGRYPGLPPRSDLPEPEWDEPCYDDLPDLIPREESPPAGLTWEKSSRPSPVSKPDLQSRAGPDPDEMTVTERIRARQRKKREARDGPGGRPGDWEDWRDEEDLSRVMAYAWATAPAVP